MRSRLDDNVIDSPIIKRLRIDSSRQVLTGNATLAADGPSVRYFDCGSANRTVTLDGYRKDAVMFVANVGAANALIVNDPVATTLGVLQPDEGMWLFSSGSDWIGLEGTGTSGIFADGDGIFDDSGNEQLIFQKTTSAVNYWEMMNAATGNAPLLAVVGDDANVSARYNTKGTGEHVFAVGGTDELKLSSTALYPNANGGLDLGTSSNRFGTVYATTLVGSITLTFADNTGLSDDSSNEQLIFQKTESAVNHWEMTNAATGAAPMLQAVGDNANVGAIWATKGTGVHTWMVNGANEMALSAAALYPTSDDGLTLGIASTNQWADLFLAAGGVIDWNNGNVLATHSTNALTFTAAGSALLPFRFHHDNDVMRIRSTQDAASVDILYLEGFRATAAANDTASVIMRLKDSAANIQTFARLRWKGIDLTNTAEFGEMIFSVVSAGSVTDFVTLTSTGVTAGALVPSANDLTALGTPTLKWSDLHLADGSVITWNATDLTLTHSLNTLTLAGGVFVFPDAGLQVGASVPFSDSAGTLTLQNVDALDATTEATIEAAIDTLVNLTSIQGHTVTLTGALVRSGAHSLTITTTGTTTVTLPTSGTLATNANATTTAAGLSEFATAAEYRTGTDTTRSLVVDQVWAAAAEVTLTDAATIAVDFSTFINAVVTLGGNRTLGNPTNGKVGQSGVIRIVQDATGSRTLAYGADWEFAGGTAPVLSTAANAQDLLFYHIIATNRIFGSLTKAIA